LYKIIHSHYTMFYFLMCHFRSLNFKEIDQKFSEVSMSVLIYPKRCRNPVDHLIWIERLWFISDGVSSSWQSERIPHRRPDPTKSINADCPMGRMHRSWTTLTSLLLLFSLWAFYYLKFFFFKFSLWPRPASISIIYLKFLNVKNKNKICKKECAWIRTTVFSSEPWTGHCVFILFLQKNLMFDLRIKLRRHNFYVKLWFHKIFLFDWANRRIRI
jgi:hypothetical protein